MKIAAFTCWALFACLVFAVAGCQPDEKTNTPEASGGDVSLNSGFEPTSIDIMPLTGPVTNSADENNLRVFVSQLDQFGSQIKSPAVFRFELYEHEKHSGNIKGKRVKLWPQFDLRDPLENNKYWTDHLRAYHFRIEAELEPNKSYILQVTCLTTNQKRLSDDFYIKLTQ